MYPHRPMTTARPDTLARERADELMRAWDGRAGALGAMLSRVTPVDQFKYTAHVEIVARFAR